MLTILGYLNIFAMIGVVGAVFYFGILSVRMCRQIISKNINPDVIAEGMLSPTLILGSLMAGLVVVEIILFIPVQFVAPAINIILGVLVINVALFVILFIYVIEKGFKDLFN